MTKSEPLAPGIYLGLDDSIYFADPAVSCSDIKKLLRSPAEYWLSSWMNPERDDPEKLQRDPMAQGKVFHTMLLEPEEFDERYFIMPGGRWCESRKMVNRSDFQAITKAIKIVRTLEGAERFFHPRFGYPEVTVVWQDRETGTMCRARHDFFCWEWTVDYKTVEEISEDFIRRTFRRHLYHLQHAHYTEGRRMVREMIIDGKADFYGDFSESFKHEFLTAREDFFTFMLQARKEPFTAMPLVLDEGSVDAALTDIRKALRSYQKYMASYGTEQPWPAAPKGVRTFSVFFGFDDAE